jgi:hypothetical protein
MNFFVGIESLELGKRSDSMSLCLVEIEAKTGVVGKKDHKASRFEFRWKSHRVISQSWVERTAIEERAKSE